MKYENKRNQSELKGLGFVTSHGRKTTGRKRRKRERESRSFVIPGDEFLPMLIETVSAEAATLSFPPALLLFPLYAVVEADGKLYLKE